MLSTKITPSSLLNLGKQKRLTKSKKLLNLDLSSNTWKRSHKFGASSKSIKNSTQSFNSSNFKKRTNSISKPNLESIYESKASKQFKNKTLHTRSKSNASLHPFKNYNMKRNKQNKLSAINLKKRSVSIEKDRTILSTGNHINSDTSDFAKVNLSMANPGKDTKDLNIKDDLSIQLNTFEKNPLSHNKLSTA